MGSIVGTWDPVLDKVVERLYRSVDAGTFAQGIVLELRVGANRLLSCGIGTDGLSKPVTAETVFAVYCCTKPIIALAIGSLVRSGELSWNDSIGDVVPSAKDGSICRYTIEQILTHTAGLHGLRAEEVLTRSRGDRAHMIASHAPPYGWSPSIHLAYSNFLGWYWLKEAIGALSGNDPSFYIRSSVIEPLGLGNSIFMGFNSKEARRQAELCGVNVDLTGRSPVPLLLERIPSFMTDPDLIAAGGYASMRGLCDFYEALLKVRNRSATSGWLSPELLNTMTLPRIEQREDSVLGRSGSWGLGFMVDLSTHMFGNCVSTGSFGHSGNSGASFAFCDPRHDLCLGVLYTAKVDPQVSVGARRASLVESIYSALELG